MGVICVSIVFGWIHPDSPTGPLYQGNKVLEIAEFINYKNALFVRNTLKKENSQVFHEMFIMSNQNHI